MGLTRSLLLMSACIGGLVFTACDGGNSETAGATEKHIKSESAALNEWFEDRYQEDLKRSPMRQTYLGLSDGLDRLDDASAAAYDEEVALAKQRLTDMRKSFNFDRLDAQSKISYRLWEYNTEGLVREHANKRADAVFNHMSGEHTGFPTFLINYHSVETIDDAKAYINRLGESRRYLGQYQSRADAQAKDGIYLPKFVYPKLISASTNVITGAPFTPGPDSSVFSDIKTKIGKLDIAAADKSALQAQAKDALLESFMPAYQDLIAMFTAHEAQAGTDDGIWRVKGGADYYQSRLDHYTTTDMTADEIHEIGKAEVGRIQAEMQTIMDKVGFKGSLKQFYTFLRTDPQFTFSNDDDGRAQYMREATAIINDMRARLDDLFITKPKADFVVKRVEPFRQDTAFGAFYNRPSTDGTRPGTYFINLKDVRDQPIYLMQSLAYHEGIPGHHMQIAIGIELDGIPEFRKQGGYTSYVEGWALYAESIPAELGMYTDPYQDFGRLSMEIFRAARLVVDTGIHQKKWTRERAVRYMMNNIANPVAYIRAEVDRYIVWPGQATAYKIGMLKIQVLRKKAEDTLGDEFDIREFHDVILSGGALPLTILEEQVDKYIKANQK